MQNRNQAIPASTSTSHSNLNLNLAGMGNSSSMSEELKQEVAKMRETLVDYEHTIKRLEKQNYEMKRELARLDKAELLSTKPRAERDDDVL